MVSGIGNPKSQIENPKGRWLSPDPLGGDITNPQSLNRYAYVMNRPTTLTDPFGLDGGCPQLYQASSPCWDPWAGGALTPPSVTPYGSPAANYMATLGGISNGSQDTAAAEAQYSAQVAANWLLQQGINPGFDKNGNLYIWMPGSQVCTTDQQGDSTCSASTKGSWEKFSDLPNDVQGYLTIQFAGALARSGVNGYTLAGWAGLAGLAALAGRYAVGGEALEEYALSVMVEAQGAGIPANAIYSWALRLLIVAGTRPGPGTAWSEIKQFSCTVWPGGC